jgi:hypothetical protein
MTGRDVAKQAEGSRGILRRPARHAEQAVGHAAERRDHHGPRPLAPSTIETSRVIASVSATELPPNFNTRISLPLKRKNPPEVIPAGCLVRCFLETIQIMGRTHRRTGEFAGCEFAWSS